MERSQFFLLCMLAVSTGGGTGCFDYLSDSRLYLQDPGPDDVGTGGTGGTGGSGGSTTVPLECIPSSASSPVGDSCGVFVSAKGDDTNDGSKAAPKRTVAAALAASDGNPVYACIDGVSGALALVEDATIYGGLDCAQDWMFVGLETKTPWTGGADEIPLRLPTGVRAKVADMAITAADATVPGGSSIVVVAEVGTQLTLERCDVSAGNGAAGAVGETPVDAVTGGLDGKPGKDAGASDSDQTGGSGVLLSCEGTAVDSGGGGNGTLGNGGAGSPGKPSGPMGAGGIGQDAIAACTAGGDGAPGVSGDAGLGAAMSLGTLGPAGITGSSGMAGGAGQPSQGGGGGGGGKVCVGAPNDGKAGASGGSGGTGACGGAGGKGGKPGGSSVGIVSLGSKLTLDTVSITTKAGGKGGDGGAGQLGGPGGKPGLPGVAASGSAACAGGKGGDGGAGGKGGGGLGGHSLGIAYAGEAPEVGGATIKTGAAGDGGLGDGDTGTGAAGTAVNVQKF